MDAKKLMVEMQTAPRRVLTPMEQAILCGAPIPKKPPLVRAREAIAEAESALAELPRE